MAMYNRIMKKYKLTKEEKEILDSYNRGEWKSILTPELKKYYQEVARYSIKLRKSKVKKNKDASFKAPVA